MSLLQYHLAATAGRAGDRRLLTGWQIIFEKRICQFCSTFVIERSPLLSAAPRAVQPCPAPGPCRGRASLAHKSHCWSCAVTQGRARSPCYTSRGSLDWYQPRLPQQRLLKCLQLLPRFLCPASLCKLPLSAGSIQTHSFSPLLAGVLVIRVY